MSLITVIRIWDDEHGPCYECGDPAAFVAPDIYRRADGSNADAPVTDANKFCGTCAAHHAADGERIFRLWVEEDDPPISDEHKRFLAELGVR